MVVADSLAPIVNAAYGDPASASGAQLLWATYCFAFQIYCDLSGYTDIAIGCARLFGFDMTRNFAYPYFSQSIPEFWRRWHITLSNWFRDYLYIPLGGNRVGPVRRYANVIIVFLASGLWHGANWTFVLWGLWHGLWFLLPIWRDARRLPVAGSSREPAQAKPYAANHGALWNKVNNLVWMFITFQVVCVGWVFFRADSLEQATYILQKIAGALTVGNFSDLKLKGAAFIIGLVIIEALQRFARHPLQFPGWPRPLRWAAYYLLVWLILDEAPLDYVPFIYFQF